MRIAFYISILLATVFGCRLKNVQPSSQTAAIPALISANTLQSYKGALPRLAAPKMDSILRSDDTLWYDEASMPKSYQDTIGDGSYTPTGLRKNSDGKRLIVDEGKSMFNRDGSNFAFPFGHTAGTDNSSNYHVINFMHLPKSGNERLPIVYDEQIDRRGFGGLGLHRWNWAFPVGTVFGEVIFVKSGSKLLPSEVRTRQRYGQGWATNVYRPFATASALAAKLRSLQAGQELISAVESGGEMKQISLSTGIYKNVVEARGYAASLPAFNNAGLVEQLLTGTTFVSTYGTPWRSEGDKVAHAVTTNEALSIVPTNYEAGFIEVTDESCKRCHEMTQKMLPDFEKESTGRTQTILYGDMWGADQIFSFHLFDITKYNGAGDENRAVRPEFASAGLAVKYNSGSHSADIYPGVKAWNTSDNRIDNSLAVTNAVTTTTTPISGGPPPTSQPGNPNPTQPGEPDEPPPPQIDDGQFDPGLPGTSGDGIDPFKARESFMTYCGRCHNPASDDRVKGRDSIPESMNENAPSDPQKRKEIESFLKKLKG